MENRLQVVVLWGLVIARRRRGRTTSTIFWAHQLHLQVVWMTALAFEVGMNDQKYF